MGTFVAILGQGGTFVVNLGHCGTFVGILGHCEYFCGDFLSLWVLLCCFLVFEGTYVVIWGHAVV